MPQQPQQNQRVLAAIVFTDVVGYSSRMQVEEEKTIALVKRDLAAFEQICADNQGRIVKTTGDGLFMYFSSLDSALKTATGILQYIDNASHAFTPDKRLEHRIGVHLGDVITNGSDVLGDGVNIAARLMDQALPDTICISYFAYDQIKNRTSLYPQFIGPRPLKNIKDPVTAVLLSCHPPLDALIPQERPAPTTKPQRSAPHIIVLFGLPITALAIMVGVYAFFGAPRIETGAPPAPSRIDVTLPTTLPSDTLPPTSLPALDRPITQKIDLLPLIDLQRDTVRGQWTRTPDGIRCQAAGLDAPFTTTQDSPSAARIALPLAAAQIPREYDLNVSLTRNDGSDSIAIIFVSGTGTAVFELDAWGKNLGGIQNVDGMDMRATTNNFTLKIQPGKRYDLSLQVRKDHVAMRVDGKQLASVPTDGSDLSLQFWELSKDKPLGVGAFKSSATFHAIQIVPVKSN